MDRETKLIVTFRSYATPPPKENGKERNLENRFYSCRDLKSSPRGRSVFRITLTLVSAMSTVHVPMSSGLAHGSAGAK